ncbi:PLD nuclease N-terminal domain-containing protein [Brachybacterium hainanense]|uniref:PLD nuclease N-terminal domain-containing protein n=1 Tax=Brachybacterium hainanense TaxID=1541174 RepID=A0ABV6RGF1_9MICO
MPRVLIALVSIGLSIFALADCIQTEDENVRGIPKWAWIVLIVLIPWVGPITWLLVGKDRSSASGSKGLAGAFGPRGADGNGGARRGRPLAPDEDPEFLRKLDEDIRRERREREQRSRREDGGGDPAPGSSPAP